MVSLSPKSPHNDVVVLFLVLPPLRLSRQSRQDGALTATNPRVVRGAALAEAEVVDAVT